MIFCLTNQLLLWKFEPYIGRQVAFESQCCTWHIALEFVVFGEALWACCWWQRYRPVFIRVHLLLSHSYESISAFVCALWTYCFCRIKCVESKAGQRLQELQKAKDTQSYFHTCIYTWLPHSRTTPTRSLTLDNIPCFHWSDNFGCQVCHKYRVMKRKQMFGGETAWSVPVWSNIGWMFLKSESTVM